MVTTTMALQQDSTGQTESITGAFTPLSNCNLSWIDGVAYSTLYRCWNSWQLDVVLPLSISDDIQTPIGVFRGRSLDANGNIALVGQANAVGGPLDTDLVQANLVGILVNAPPA